MAVLKMLSVLLLCNVAKFGIYYDSSVCSFVSMLSKYTESKFSLKCVKTVYNVCL